MRAELRREGGYWSVYVNGRRMVDRESFAVADRIVDELKSPGCHYPSESWEVARSIREHAEAAGDPNNCPDCGEFLYEPHAPGCPAGGEK